jgi:hypothetical protein
MAERRRVEAFDAGKDVAPGFCPCRRLPVMDQFGFGRVKEALHRGIVVAVGHAAFQPLPGALDPLSDLRTAQ